MHPMESTVTFIAENDAPTTLRDRYAGWLGGPTDVAPERGLLLVLDRRGLRLQTRGEHPALSLRIDYTVGPMGWRLAHASLRREAIARACGLKRGRRPAVVDATAGLGRDAILLAHLGVEVTLIERSPVLVALIDDALHRASETPALATTVERTRLLHGNSVEQLDWLAAGATPDVVYLDPMFERAAVRGAVGKEMTLLQRLLGGTGDTGETLRLLSAARRAADNRVVVKRHRKAAALGDLPADECVTGRSTRFDIYLKN